MLVNVFVCAWVRAGVPFVCGCVGGGCARAIKCLCTRMHLSERMHLCVRTCASLLVGVRPGVRACVRACVLACVCLRSGGQASVICV